MLRPLNENKSVSVFAPVLILMGAVFSVLGKNATGYMWVSSILERCPDEAGTLLAGFLFPVIALVICLGAKRARVKLSFILFAKICLELLLFPFGINLNIPTGLFFGDLELVFFVFTDIILLCMVQYGEFKRDAEKAAAAVAFAAVAIVCGITLFMHHDFYVVMRVLYVLCTYGLVYLLAAHMKELDYLDADYRLSDTDTNGFLIATGAMAALCALSTTGLTLACSNDILSIPVYEFAKAVCSACWCGLCVFLALLVVCFICEYSKTLCTVLSVVSAVAGTAVSLFVTAYIRSVRSTTISSGLLNFSMKEAFGINLADAASYEYFHILALFAFTFALAWWLTNLVGKVMDLSDDFDEYELDELDELDDLDFDAFDLDEPDFPDSLSREKVEENKSPYGSAAKTFSFAKNEECIISLDDPDDDDIEGIFESDSFVMDGKEYDVLVSFSDDADKVKFIVYTDNSKEKDGRIRAYAAKLDPSVDKRKLVSLDGDAEWRIVERILDVGLADESDDDEDNDDGESHIKEKTKSDGEIDTFATLCYLAKAIAADDNNESAFILATKGDVQDDELVSVTIRGSKEEKEILFKCTMMSLMRTFKAEGLSTEQAYRKIKCLLLNSVLKMHCDDITTSYDDDEEDENDCDYE